MVRLTFDVNEIADDGICGALGGGGEACAHLVNGRDWSALIKGLIVVLSFGREGRADACQVRSVVLAAAEGKGELTFCRVPPSAVSSDAFGTARITIFSVGGQNSVFQAVTRIRVETAHGRVRSGQIFRLTGVVFQRTLRGVALGPIAVLPVAPTHSVCPRSSAAAMLTSMSGVVENRRR